MTDPLKIMNAVMRWSAAEGVPPMDDRWLKKIAALCEYAAALKSLYVIRTKQYRARCQGTIRDTRTDSVLVQAMLQVEGMERELGIKES